MEDGGGGVSAGIVDAFGMLEVQVEACICETVVVI